jgi:hypothetical protein
MKQFLVGLAIIAIMGLVIAVTAITANGQCIESFYRPYHGMVEKGYNRGPFIDSANRWARVPLGSSYCASAGGMVLMERVKPTYPHKPTIPARSRAWITDDAIHANKVWLGKATIPVPSVGIWTRKGGGHWMLVYMVQGDRIYAFEFNTSPDVRGSQWNGAWSGFKIRSIAKDCSPTNPYRITHFVPIERAS